MSRSRGIQWPGFHAGALNRKPVSYWPCSSSSLIVGTARSGGRAANEEHRAQPPGSTRLSAGLRFSLVRQGESGVCRIGAAIPSGRDGGFV
jgi:hypothetical protein